MTRVQILPEIFFTIMADRQKKKRETAGISYENNGGYRRFLEKKRLQPFVRKLPPINYRHILEK